MRSHTNAENQGGGASHRKSENQRRFAIFTKGNCMPNFNRVFLMGHLTRDVETRYTPSGTAVGSFAMAVNREWKNQDGEKQKETSFFECTAFGKQAETLAEYVHKGDPLFLEGRLKQDSWDDIQFHKYSICRESIIH